MDARGAPEAPGPDSEKRTPWSRLGRKSTALGSANGLLDKGARMNQPIQELHLEKIVGRTQDARHDLARVVG